MQNEKFCNFFLIRFIFSIWKCAPRVTTDNIPFLLSASVCREFFLDNLYLVMPYLIYCFNADRELVRNVRQLLLVNVWLLAVNSFRRGCPVVDVRSFQKAGFIFGHAF